jgi:hypothetical protein
LLDVVSAAQPINAVSCQQSAAASNAGKSANGSLI